MWKNGKEGDTEGDESWKEKKEKTGDGRRLKRKKKWIQGKRGDAAGDGRGAAGQERKGERGVAGTSSGKQSGRKQNNCGMA